MYSVCIRSLDLLYTCVVLWVLVFVQTQYSRIFVLPVLPSCQILRPVAMALDRLQSDDSGFMGYLIPEIVSLKVRLNNVVRNDPSTHQSPQFFTKFVVMKINERVDFRFNAVLHDLHCQVATAFHPLFGLAWTSASVNGLTQDEVSELRGRIKDKMAAILGSINVNNKQDKSSSTDDETELVDADEENRLLFIGQNADDLGLGRIPTAAIGPSQLEAYLSPCEARSNGAEAKTMKQRSAVWKSKRDRKTLFPDEAYVEAFIRCNTGCPSSASVERLFSQGGDFMRAKRASMSNAVFEQVMFLRGNIGLNMPDGHAPLTASFPPRLRALPSPTSHSQ